MARVRGAGEWGRRARAAETKIERASEREQNIQKTCYRWGSEDDATATAGRLWRATATISTLCDDDNGDKEVLLYDDPATTVTTPIPL